MRSPAKYLLPFLTLIFAAAASHANGAEFSGYDECILESLKGVSSDVAANAIIASCRNKFPDAAAAAEASARPSPEPQPAPEPASAPEPARPAEAKPDIGTAGASRELTPDEMANLKATLFGFTTKYTVTFENFNDAIAITEVTIAVWDEFDPRGLKKYTETMQIPPAGSAKVTYEVIYMGDDQGWRWKVDSAKGIPLIN